MRAIRLALPFGIILGSASTPQARIGLWVGGEGLYYRPLKTTIIANERFVHFWGLGSSVGWVFHKHAEMGLEFNYVYCSPKGESPSWEGQLTTR